MGQYIRVSFSVISLYTRKPDGLFSLLNENIPGQTDHTLLIRFNEKSKNNLECENTYDNVPGNNCEMHEDPPDNNDDDDDNYFYRPSSTSNKYQDQCTSTRKLKKKLNNSLPSIPPVVPPHATSGTLDGRILSNHRIYAPTSNRYVIY